MRTRAAITSVFASLGVLAVGWQLGASTIAAENVASTTSTTTEPATDSSESTSEPTTTSTPESTEESAPEATTASSDGTWTGDLVDTRYGTVQVEVTISGGTITDVTAIKLTDAHAKSVQISNNASPLLAQAVLASQSANVSNISGATYTADAYLQSVQSALDQAGI